jgi:hypothetical protein
MSRELPHRPNLEHLRKQAKERLVELRGKDSRATLADAQHAIAAEYGFDSWPKLKAHVESVVPISPFVGVWQADIARSERHPSNLFQRATLEFAVDGDAVTIKHEGVSETGTPETGAHTVYLDDVERSFPHGYTMRARWLRPRTFEVAAMQHGQPAGGGTYEVSREGDILSVSTPQQRIVFLRTTES